MEGLRRSADARPADSALSAPQNGPAGQAGAAAAVGRTCRPDVVHIATEGPLGWSALQAALQLRLPVVLGLPHQLPCLQPALRHRLAARPIMAYLRKFHNRTALTMVPTGLARRTASLRLQGNLRWWRAVSTRSCSTPPIAANACASWGVATTTPVVLSMWAAGRREEPGHAAAAFTAIRRAARRRACCWWATAGAQSTAAHAARRPSFAGVRRGERPGSALCVGRPVSSFPASPRPSAT
jgi:hypothetical protein